MLNLGKDSVDGAKVAKLIDEAMDETASEIADGEDPAGLWDVRIVTVKAEIIKLY